MEEILEGGRGPPRAVAPLEEEKEESVCFKDYVCCTMYVFFLYL